VTKAEYLEFVEEVLHFPQEPGIALPMQDGTPGLYPVDPAMQLRESPEMCRALQRAHSLYCDQVEAILFPDRAEAIAVRAVGNRRLWDAEDVHYAQNRALKIMQNSVNYAADHGFVA
jgi:hypothetical protein